MNWILRLGLAAMVAGVGLVQAGPRIAAGGGGAVSSFGPFSVYIDDSGVVWRWGFDFAAPIGPISQQNPAVDTHARRVDELVGSLALAAGGRHLLALRADGTVWAMGQNSSGQLGDGTTQLRSWAAPVSGLTGVVSIAADAANSLAVRTDGTVWAWGHSAGGTLAGPAAPNPILMPTQVPGLTGVIQIAAATDFWMALKSDGTVWVWGSNQFGQFGDGTTGSSRSTPAPVPGLAGVTSVAAGLDFCLALLNDGTVRSWGSNLRGQLGDGTTSSRATPAPVSGLSDVAAIVAGHTSRSAFARSTGGAVWGWGENAAGQLGDGTRVRRLIPIQPEGLGAVEELAAGILHTVALLNDGTLRAWGANLANQLNTGGLIFQPIPVRVAEGTPYAQIDTGANHSAARQAGGGVWSWGTNREGQLGDATTEPRAQPAPANAFSNVAWIAAGSTQTLAALMDGTVWETTSGGATAQVDGLAGVTAVSMRGSHKVALLADGTLRAWDYPGTFYLPGSEPVRAVTGLTGATRISAGNEHALALRDDGTVWAWGRSDGGRLGTGQPMAYFHPPAQVVGLADAISISAGFEHSLAVTEDGRVWAWGRGQMGQLGQDIAATMAHVPVEVPTVTGAVAVAAGQRFSLALRADGTVWSWGDGTYGALGRGSPYTPFTPAPVAGLRNIVAISAGETHALALDSDGAVWAWGMGMDGQLGGGELSFRTRPTPVAMLGGGELALSMTTSGPLSVGTTAKFRIAVRNVGVASITGVTTMRIVLSDGVTHQSGTGEGWTCLATGTTASCTHAGPVAPGSEIAMELRATLGLAAYPASTVAVTIENPNDLNPSNDAAGTSFTSYLSTTLTPVVNNALSGEGLGHLFYFEFTAPGGAEDLGVVNMLLNSALDGRQACYLAYVRQSNLLYLVADNGGTLLGPLAMNGTGEMSNSQCTVSGVNTTVTVVGPYLRLLVNISFKPTFQGHRIWYLAARDRVGGTSGWIPAGVWTVPIPLVHPVPTPRYLKMDARRTQGPSAYSSFYFYDSMGAGNLNVINLLLNNALDGRHACYLAYVVPTNTLYLVNDAGTALLPGIPADGTGTLSNSQCTIINPSVEMVQFVLVFGLRVTPTPGFAGHRLWYVAARDKLGGNTGWIPAGSWTVEP